MTGATSAINILSLSRGSGQPMEHGSDLCVCARTDRTHGAVGLARCSLPECIDGHMLFQQRPPRLHLDARRASRPLPAKWRHRLQRGLPLRSPLRPNRAQAVAHALPGEGAGHDQAHRGAEGDGLHTSALLDRCMRRRLRQHRLRRRGCWRGVVLRGPSRVRGCEQERRLLGALHRRSVSRQTALPAAADGTSSVGRLRTMRL